MSANVTLPGTGSVIETVDISGVERQVVTIGDRAGTAVDSIGGLTETAPTSDTASSGLNGRLQRIAQRLTTMMTGLVLAAGTNVIGKVGIDQTTVGTTDSVSVKSQGFSSKVSITRPANTTAYTAGDVVGATAAAITFSNMGPSAGGEIMITSAAFEIDQSAMISGETSYRLYLYNVTPPSALADNAPWDLPSGDRASFLGYIDLGIPVDLGSTCYVEENILNKQITLASSSLFGYLVTSGAFTPTSARVQDITLHSVAV